MVNLHKEEMKDYISHREEDRLVTLWHNSNKEKDDLRSDKETTDV